MGAILVRLNDRGRRIPLRTFLPLPIAIRGRKKTQSLNGAKTKERSLPPLPSLPRRSNKATSTTESVDRRRREPSWHAGRGGRKRPESPDQRSPPPPRRRRRRLTGSPPGRISYPRRWRRCAHTHPPFLATPCGLLRDRLPPPFSLFSDSPSLDK